MRHGFFLIGFTFLMLSLPVFVFLALQQQDNRQYAQQETEVLLIPDKLAATGGEKLTLQVDVKPLYEPVTAVQLTLVYPEDKLLLDRVEEGNTAFETPSENLNRNGFLRVGRETAIPVAEQKGVMTIHFNVIGDVTASEIKSAPGSPIVSGINKPLQSSIRLVDETDALPQNNVSGFEAFIATISAFFQTLNPLKG
jgi:hypothetical protein